MDMMKLMYEYNDERMATKKLMFRNVDEKHAYTK